MLDLVRPIRFDKKWTSGRTRPCQLTCINPQKPDEEIELIVKFSAGCDRGVHSLTAEAIAAMLATDLNLPVPEPFLVDIDIEFVTVIPDPVILSLARHSSPVAFGSRKLPAGFSTWPINKPLPQKLVPTCAEILAFDALIQNTDRRPVNPNCLFKGEQVAIYDHELAFFTEGVIGWKPPWQMGGLDVFNRPDFHIFTALLKGQPVDFGRLTGAWLAVSDQRLKEYQSALPQAWLLDRKFVSDTLAYLAQVRQNIHKAVEAVARILI